MDDKELVRRGYDAIAEKYVLTRNEASEDVLLLDELVTRLPKGAKVLDAGCGAGVPVTRILSRSFSVTGVDFSQAQIDLAQRNVPEASFICCDMVGLDLPEDSFDAICSYYAIIHIPREEHRELFRNFHRLLKSGGLAWLCLGANDLRRDVEADYLGAPMFWSHFDTETNLKLLEEAGFEIVLSHTAPDCSCPTSHHLFVLARK